jgi:hypothetical protein
MNSQRTEEALILSEFLVNFLNLILALVLGRYRILPAFVHWRCKRNEDMIVLLLLLAVDSAEIDKLRKFLTV